MRLLKVCLHCTNWDYEDRMLMLHVKTEAREGKKKVRRKEEKEITVAALGHRMPNPKHIGRRRSLEKVDKRRQKW